MEYCSNRNGDGVVAENGHCSMIHNTLYQPNCKASLAWLDLRVFYVRISRLEINEKTPEFLTLNHIPLNRDALLEVNNVRTSIYSDSVSSVLRRDRFDKKSEEVTFVSTDSLRISGSMKFEVFDRNILVVSGVLEFRNGKWRMNCETDEFTWNRFLRGKQKLGPEKDLPAVEICLAGCFEGEPIILTKTLQLGFRKKQIKKGMLETIPECEATANQNGFSSGLVLQQVSEYQNQEPENEEYRNVYSGLEYLEGEDGEMSWFNAGVRVGVGIGLSVCLGLGIGMGLLVRTYQSTARNFRRRIL